MVAIWSRAFKPSATLGQASLRRWKAFSCSGRRRRHADDCDLARQRRRCRLQPAAANDAATTASAGVAMVVPPMRFAHTELGRKGVWRKRLRPKDGATAPTETP